MPERGFTQPRQERESWRNMLENHARRVAHRASTAHRADVRAGGRGLRRPAKASTGCGRRTSSTTSALRQAEPAAGRVDPRFHAGAMLLGVLVSEGLLRRLDLHDPRAWAGRCWATTALLIAAVVIFGQAHAFAVTYRRLLVRLRSAHAAMPIATGLTATSRRAAPRASMVLPDGCVGTNRRRSRRRRDAAFAARAITISGCVAHVL